MNEIVEITKSIALCEREQVAKQILTVCSAITPAFWHNKTTQELQAEKLSIELLTSNIQNECLAKMCELAIKNYPKDHSFNDKIYFDINYIMKFYIKAFNLLYCYSIDKKTLKRRIDYSYDTETGILREVWQTKDDAELVVMYISEDNKECKYSPLFHELLFTDLDGETDL